MPYEIEWRTRGVTWAYTGQLTGAELLGSNLEIYGDERFDDLAYQIVDLSGVTEVLVNETDMRKVAHLDMAAARTNPRIRIAVIEGPAESLAVCADYQKHASKSPWTMETFRTREEAEAWVESCLKASNFRECRPAGSVSAHDGP